MGTSSYFRFVAGRKRLGVRVNWSRVNSDTLRYFFNGRYHVECIEQIPDRHADLPHELRLVSYLPFEDTQHPLAVLHVPVVRAIIGEYLDASCSTLTSRGRLMSEWKIQGSVVLFFFLSVERFMDAGTGTRSFARRSTTSYNTGSSGCATMVMPSRSSM